MDLACDRVKRLSFHSAQSTFPYCEHPPSELSQLPTFVSVALQVACYFRDPEFPVGFRNHEEMAPMTVPEAAMNENSGPVPRENEIRRPRKVPTVKLVPKPEGEKGFPD